MSHRLLPLVLLSALAACVHAPAAPLPSEGAGSPGPVSFRVLTLNTAHGTVLPQAGMFIPQETVAKNLTALAGVLARERADVVALQEVHRGTGERGLDHAARVADAAHYPHHFFGEHLVSSGRWPAHGTALLSSLELQGASSHAFGLAAGDDKGYVLATVKPPALGGVEVDVVSVHLDPFSERKRILQMDDMVRALSGRGRPLVVMGDFNTGWGRDGGVHRLAERLRLRAFRPATGERTYPVLLPISRIDWILVSPQLRFLSYRTFRDGVTDHCGVVAELGLAPSLSPSLLVRRAEPSAAPGASAQ